jgi:acyl-CoA synthetase (AMP-forming)/AMP-acid ligase II
VLEEKMPETVVHLLKKSVSRYPDSEAVVYKNQRVSYLQLWNMICSVADYLHAKGIERGDRVGLLVENSPEYIAAYYGVLTAGGVAVGLNTAAKAADLTNWLRHCGARYLFSSLKHPELDDIAKACSDDMSIVGIGGPEKQTVSAFDLWHEIINKKAAEPNLSEITDVMKPAAIIYTSGTTGNPKGVTLSHRNLTSNTQSIIKYLGLTNKDSIVSVLPFYYSFGNSVMHTHLAVGGKLVLENNFVYPNKVLEKMVEEGVTGFSGVPSTYALLLSRTKLKDYDLSRIRYMTQAGGAMAPASIKRFLKEISGVEFFVMYGQTEGTARLSYLPPENLINKMGSIGKAVPGVTLKIRDANGKTCPPGVTGEICAMGNNIMLGYWNDPETTSEVIKDGWLKTGDLAHYDEDGYLYVDGRSSDMIKVGANRISPKEIEEVIAHLVDVEEVAVVGMPDELLGQVIKAIIVPVSDRTLNKKTIQAHCRKNLSTYKIPKIIEFTNELPKTASGKVKRYLLQNNK